jgi:diaminopimelate epimerase
MAPVRPLGLLEFARYEGLGNDYLVVDNETFGATLTPRAAIWLCDRHRGVGSDGVLVRQPQGRDGAHCLRIFNPDGSEAEKSGNGLRIFARFLRDFGYSTESRMVIDTVGGRVVASIHGTGQATSITVAMGQARFGSAAVHVAGPARPMEREVLAVDGDTLDITCVSIGNPHCVAFVSELDAVALRRLGPHIEHHSHFTRRTNVQFARIDSRRAIAILIWERGAGETHASGSSSCAAAAAAVKRGLIDADVPIAVSMPGGTLNITVARNYAVTLQGPAEPICRGTLWAPPPDAGPLRQAVVPTA